VDLLEIDSHELYFEEPLNPQAQQLLDQAAEAYGQPAAETLLQRAYELEPAHPMVLVARYRFFYYQHRLAAALEVAEQVLRVFAQRLQWPDHWRDLSPALLGTDAAERMNLIRFYLLALKGAGFLELRLGQHAAAIMRLEKVLALDEQDRLGAGALLAVARNALADGG